MLQEPGIAKEGENAEKDLQNPVSNILRQIMALFTHQSLWWAEKCPRPKLQSCSKPLRLVDPILIVKCHVIRQGKSETKTNINDIKKRLQPPKSKNQRSLKRFEDSINTAVGNRLLHGIVFPIPVHVLSRFWTSAVLYYLIYQDGMYLPHQFWQWIASTSVENSLILFWRDIQ